MNGKEAVESSKFPTVGNLPIITLEKAKKFIPEADKQTAEWVKEQCIRLEDSARLLIEVAINIGEVLCVVQEKTDHGDFVKWLTDSVQIASTSAYRYIALFKHKEKVSGAKNLTDAYKKIEASMTVKKEKEKVQAEKRAEEYNKTGRKPEGWRKHTDDKLAKELKEQKEETEEEIDTPSLPETATENEPEQETTEKRQPLLRRDGTAKKPKSSDELFIESIQDYIDDLSTPEKKVAMCRAIMKVCREIIVDYNN